MSLLKTNEIQVFSGTTVTITATTTEVSSDLNVGANLDVTGALTLGTALAVAEGGTGATDAATARTNLDVDQAGTDNSTDCTLVTTSHDYLSITGQAITLGPIDLAADVTGTLATSNGGTGVTSLGSLDAADLGSGTATDGYVLTADGAGGAAWEAKAPIDLLSSGASIRKSDGTTAILSESSGEVNLTNVNLTSSVGNLPSNQNLIINGDFRVNQRGAASRTATSNAYNYDRWYYDGTNLYQVIEDLNVVNGDYTISWSGSGLTAAWVISSNTTSSIPASFNTVTSGSSFTVSGKTTGDHLWIRFGGTLANLADVQLEAGTVATPFERRLIGTELTLCQRYFEKSYNQATALGSADTGYDTAIMYIAPRNITPAQGVTSIRYSVSKRSTGDVTIYSANNGATGNVYSISGASNVSVSGIDNGESGYSIIFPIIDVNIYAWNWSIDSEL